MTFLHALICIPVFEEKPKFAKIYGTYFHSIVKHLPEHARIISTSSLYTESEERIFNALREIGRDATNRLQSSVRDIGIVRYVSLIFSYSKNNLENFYFETS